MTPLKRAMLASSASVLMLSAAGALAPANAQTPPIYNWTGFYIGANAGAAWGRSHAITSVICDGHPGSYICGTTPTTASQSVSASGTGRLRDSGFTGGGQAGYNWQAGNFVYGAELDFGAFHLKGSRSATSNYGGFFAVSPFNIYTIGSTFETDWLFTARG